MTARKSPVIAFFPEASFGAALNCIGIAQALAKLGATPVFITHGGFTGVFSDYGFEEHYVEPSSASTIEETGRYWEEFLARHLPHFNLTPQQQLTTYVAPVWDAIVDTAVDLEEGLSHVLNQIAPDLIVLDNVIMFPAIARFGCPWVRIVSCAETEVRDANVPPYLSGLDPSERSQIAEFNREYLDAVELPHKRYNSFRAKAGLSPLPDGEFLENSGDLNLLLAPSIVRFDRKNPLEAPNFALLEGCVRDERPYQVPEFPANDGPLVYLSFGSLGSTDVQFLQRIIDAVSTIPARFLVNVGALIESYSKVPDNVHLQDWFPQPSVIAQCDLFIHHGGNNSFCEALYFGVPSLIIPYCWDGHDTARRAVECGVGDRLDRWNMTDTLLQDKITTLLESASMRARLQENAKAMQQKPGAMTAARNILDVLPAKA